MRPADVAARFPKPDFDIARVQTFQPPMSRAAQWFAGLNFAVLLGGVIVFLWHADSLPLAQAGVELAALSAGLWAVGAVTQGRITMLEALLIQAAALATATSTAGMPDLYRLVKPVPMLIAIFMIAIHDRSTLGRGPIDAKFRQIAPSGRLWLLAALAGSLAGDVFLLFPGYFVPGLVASCWRTSPTWCCCARAWAGSPAAARWSPRWAWARRCTPSCGRVACRRACAHRWPPT